jgi:MFS family permease
MLYFGGYSVSILPVPWLADIFGRKKVFLNCMIIQTLCYATLIISNSLNLSYIAMFIAGLATSGRNFVGYPYMCEFLSEKQ